MIDQGEFPAPSEPLEDRIPYIGMREVLDDIWKRQTHQDDRYNEPVADNLKYQDLAPQVTVALEHLARVGKAPALTTILDSSGRLINSLTEAELRASLIDQKPLEGVSVFVLGGTEGRIFAEMGATALNLYNSPIRFPGSDMPNLTELEGDFGFSFARQHQDEFDLTFSSRVFDTGSGLTESMMEYENYFRNLVDMTKPGGLGVHNGTMMKDTLKEVLSYLKKLQLVEVAPVNERSHKINWFSTVYVVQKQG